MNTKKALAYEMLFAKNKNKSKSLATNEGLPWYNENYNYEMMFV